MIKKMCLWCNRHSELMNTHGYCPHCGQIERASMMKYAAVLVMVISICGLVWLGFSL